MGITNDVQQSYPGGVNFLESSKMAKLEELVGYTEATKNLKNMKTNYLSQFSKEE